MTDFDKAGYKDLDSNLYQKKNIVCYYDSSSLSRHCWDIYDVKYFSQYMAAGEYNSYFQINEHKFKTKSYHESKEAFFKLQKIFEVYKDIRSL